MFYEFHQNNTGGSFEVTDTLCRRLFIEADSEAEAITKAEELGCYWDGVVKGIDCPCCGDRWYRHPRLVDEVTFGNIRFSNIEEYAQYLANNYGGWTTPEARIFYADGKVVEIKTARETRKGR